jgi:hypothetical protein
MISYKQFVDMGYDARATWAPLAGRHIMPRKFLIPLLAAAFLALPTLAVVMTTGLSSPAVAESSVKSSKSNTSDREGTSGKDQLKGTTKKGKHAGERSTNLNSSKSNRTNLNSSKSNRTKKTDEPK